MQNARFDEVTLSESQESLLGRGRNEINPLAITWLLGTACRQNTTQMVLREMLNLP